MKKILCIGSATSDVIVRPADSVPTPGSLRAVEGISAHVGGCAVNASIDIKRLGGEVDIVCAVGDDIFGRLVTDTLEAEGLDTAGVTVKQGVSTSVSVVCVSGQGERSFLYDPGASAVFDSGDIPENALDGVDIVFIAGSTLMTAFNGEQAAAFMKKARAAGRLTVLDTAWDFTDEWMPKLRPILPFLDIFMPSYDEAVMFAKSREHSEIVSCFRDAGAGDIILKQGNQGAFFYPKGEESYRLPTYESVKPVDTTGAGDAFCAGFLYGLAQGWDYKAAGRLANAVGTHCVMAVGATTGIKSFEETLKFMEEHESGQPA